MKHEQLPFLLPGPGAVEEALPPESSPFGQELQRVKEAPRDSKIP